MCWSLGADIFSCLKSQIDVHSRMLTLSTVYLSSKGQTFSIEDFRGTRVVTVQINARNYRMFSTLSVGFPAFTNRLLLQFPTKVNAQTYMPAMASYKLIRTKFLFY